MKIIKKTCTRAVPKIALCTLGSLNWGAFRNPQDMRKACRVLVRSLSNLLNYQDFLSIQSKLANIDFEPLGVGITNLAYWHAKRNLKYGEANALAEVKRWAEYQAFYLTEASVELAKERGACARSGSTWYGRGVFPWERRNKNVDELTSFAPELNWEPLRADMIKYGIRNATLMAIAPVESCQSWRNTLALTDGSTPNFHELLSQDGIDWN
jgi:ribonucleoside-diphosphate reductase alpha chain